MAKVPNKVNKPKHRAVIFTKTIICEDSNRAFYNAIQEALERTEEAGQEFGWAQSIVSDIRVLKNDSIDDEYQQQFDAEPEDYQ